MNPKIALPSKIKVDMNEISGCICPGNGYLSTSCPIHWSYQKAYKPRKRKSETLLWPIFVALFLIVGFWFLVWTTVFPEPAGAQVKTAKDCMTNEECCESISGGFGYYFKDYSPIKTSKEEVLAGCEKYL